MDAYYSSDEDIAWGIVTPKELCATAPTKNLKRRTEMFKFSDCMKEAVPAREPVLSLVEEVANKLNVSVTSSEYYTPNESLRNEKSAQSTEDFLKKLTKVINDTDESAYASALDNVNRTNNGNYALDNINCTRLTNANIDNIQQTLVENTILLSDSSTCSTSTKDEEKVEEPIDEAIEISDESTSDCFDSSEENVELNTTPEDYIDKSHETSKNSFVSSAAEVVEIEEVHNEVTSEELPVKDDSIVIEVPEIDIDQFDDSNNLSSTSNFSFNDTLEEMNRFLSQGADYCMSEAGTSSSEPLELDPSFSRNMIISGSQLKKPELNHQKPPTSVIPIATSYKNHPTCARKPILSPQMEKFKVPAFPRNNRLTPNAKSPYKQQFKNIVSPVGIYINSPRVCLKQNIPNRTLSRTTAVKKDKTNDIFYDDLDLPEVIYKPAPKQLVTRENVVNLPSGIQKLVNQPLVTKHDGRIKNKILNESGIHKRLMMDANLTTSIADDSQLNSTNADISILTTKQAFVK